MLVVIVFVVYALLLFAEAGMTYGKTQSRPTLTAGLLSGGVVVFATILVLIGQVSLGVSTGLGVMLAMMGVFGSRYMKTRAFFPTGIMMTITLVALGVLFRLMRNP
jgi:uncharacterized membrane protein (UPF0136 family)